MLTYVRTQTGDTLVQGHWHVYFQKYEHLTSLAMIVTLGILVYKEYFITHMDRQIHRLT